MNRLILFLLLSSFIMGCAPASNSPEPATVKHTYTASDAAILNPERGFFTPYELPGSAGFSPVRATGNTLVHLNIRLDDWRETDIPQSVLDGLDQNFADIRDAGVKAIIRFAYNQGPYPDSEPDASKAQILRHIEQLTPLLQKNGDVIAWAEAGFIGAWGEWHTSTHGLDNITDKKDILFALLKALPENRMAQVRYPANIIEMFPNSADAVKARVAHHNDCFLSSDTDVGTYERDGTITIERDQAYLAELTRFTPMSGETCAPNPPRSECESAINEMELLHFSAINEAYHKGILRSWEDGGCMEEINNRLGYRLSLISSDFNEQVRPGGLLNLSVNLQNTGFASLMNPRPLFVVLQQNNSIFLTTLELDSRKWEPGIASFAVKLRLPSNIAAGQYNLALWLPDEAETLQNNPLYAVQFANQNIWDEKTGYNLLGSIDISKSAPGSYKRADFLTVEELNISGSIPLPTSLPASTAAPEATTAPASTELISNIQVSNDTQKLNIEFTFTGNPVSYNGFQAFLDTDQNPATGFSVNGIGADFLLENETLNAYSGTGSDWSWEPLETDLSFTSENQTVKWTLPYTSLQPQAFIDLGFKLVDKNWDEVFTIPKITFTFQ